MKYVEASDDRRFAKNGLVLLLSSLVTYFTCKMLSWSKCFITVKHFGRATVSIRSPANEEVNQYHLLMLLFQQVGVTGYCMGGALSIAAAALVGELSAAAPFYGVPKAELCDVKTINIPVQANFGELDTIAGFSAPEDARAFEAAVAGKKNFELFMYPTSHGFTNPNNKENYNKECADLALSRTVNFMMKHLGSARL